MTTTIQARVPELLADAARQRAERLSVSVSQYLADLVRSDVERAEDEAFWADFTAYYDAQHVVEAQAEAEVYAGSLLDGSGDR